MGWAALFHVHMYITALNTILQQTDFRPTNVPPQAIVVYQSVTWVSMGTIFCQGHAVFFSLYDSPENMRRVGRWIREYSSEHEIWR